MFYENPNREYELHKEYHARQGENLKNLYQDGETVAHKNRSINPGRIGTTIVVSAIFIIMYVFFSASSAEARTDRLPTARQWALIRNGESLDEGHILLADDWMLHDPQLGDRNSMAELVEWVDWQRSLMPDDYNYSVDDQKVVDNLLVVMWTMSGTHTGEVDGIPATGNAIVIYGITFHRMVDDVIVESWVHFDNQKLRYQIGLEDSPTGTCLICS